MTYTKPEVSILGKAACVIEHINPKGGTSVDSSLKPNTAPAYDLDE